MKVRIKKLAGGEALADVSECDSIEGLKHRVLRDQGIPLADCTHFKLVHKGAAMDELGVVSDYRVRDEDEIVVALKMAVGCQPPRALEPSETF
eukprot:m51a1_g4941 hypothetical protein (93) ;mRNA; f:303541-303996